MGASSGERTFDLSELSEREWKGRRSNRYVFVALIVLSLSLLVVAGAPGWLYGWATGHGFPVGGDWFNGVTTVGLLGLAVLGIVLLVTLKPTPISMTIDASRVTFRSSRGRPMIWNWSDPKFRFDIYDYHDLPEQDGITWRARQMRSIFDYVLRSRSDAFVTGLTRDDVDALLEAARSRGLPVTPTKPEIHFSGGENPRAHVLRVSRAR